MGRMVEVQVTPIPAASRPVQLFFFLPIFQLFRHLQYLSLRGGISDKGIHLCFLQSCLVIVTVWFQNYNFIQIIKHLSNTYMIYIYCDAYARY